MRTGIQAFIFAVLSALLLAAPPAFAVDDLGLFELDGNAVKTTAGDDWDNITGAFITTNIPVSDGSPITIFTGGRKDIQAIAEWAHKSGSVPDKDDITNAYAAAYNHGGDLVVYFGADRYSNVGDAFLGFWFFKDAVTANPDGTFSGEHVNGDTLVLVNFPQASNAEPLVQVVEWDTSCVRADSSKPAVDQCAASNLRLIRSNSGDSAALCGPGGDDVCAITNNGTEVAPWAYTSKDGFVNQFPYETFFEGGINLSKIVGDTCFSSFMAETRSSSSFTASLKDFVLDDFKVCGLSITKDCTLTELNASQTGFVNTYSGTVTNTGFGTLYDVIVVDETGGTTHNIGPLDAGQTLPYNGTFESTLNPATNFAHAEAATSPGGDKTVTAGPVSDQCPGLSLSPVIDVTKSCYTRLEPLDGKIVVKVYYSGQVCNITGGGADGPIGLVNVSATDDSGTPGNTADDVILFTGVTLNPGACQSYSGSYAPASANSTIPNLINFSDTVTAGGTAKLGFGDVVDTASATCPICP